MKVFQSKMGGGGVVRLRPRNFSLKYNLFDNMFIKKRNNQKFVLIHLILKLLSFFFLLLSVYCDYIIFKKNS